MTIFQDIADQYAIADAAFAVAEQGAFDSDDDVAFDKASEQRRHNDQAYFLYLFTRFERAVNQAVGTLLAARMVGPWADRRIWQAWSRGDSEDIYFLSKAEVLTDKSMADYRSIKQFYDARNRLAHGDDWEDEFAISVVALQMDQITARFAIA